MRLFYRASPLTQAASLRDTRISLLAVDHPRVAEVPRLAGAQAMRGRFPHAIRNARSAGRASRPGPHTQTIVRQPVGDLGHGRLPAPPARIERASGSREARIARPSTAAAERGDGR